MDKVKVPFQEYKRLWAKFIRYSKIPRASTNHIEKALGVQVSRITNAAHAKLPPSGAIKLVNEICEKARAEVEGYSRILTVSQALEKKTVPTRTQERDQPKTTASGIYLP